MKRCRVKSDYRHDSADDEDDYSANTIILLMADVAVRRTPLRTPPRVRRSTKTGDCGTCPHEFSGLKKLWR